MPEEIGSFEFAYLDETDRKYNKETKVFESTLKEKMVGEVERCGDGESFKTWFSTFKSAAESHNEDDVSAKAV